MLLAAHQPDFLPWSGFWWKVWKADLFDLAVYDQYSSGGFHARVPMGPDSEWVGCRVPRKPNKYKPIVEVEFEYAFSRERVLADIDRFYGDRPFVKPVLDMVAHSFDQLEVIDGQALLVELNLSLIRQIAEWLEIDTVMDTARPLTRPKDEGIVELCEFYGADAYLSGAGAREYLDPENFSAAGIELEWSTHVPVSKNSIVEALASSSVPMEVVARG